MPRCTWHGESGAHLGQWAAARARNPQSTAGGKFQVIDSTWYANGGRRNGDHYPAAAASPVEQERVARRVLRSQGLHAWVLC
ncbi:MAG: transglycosylase family protein [Solirubrobacteraceae bacterium]|nr:transglycosylase family protein [Solirubrobacteraceae bacterium]